MAHLYCNIERESRLGGNFTVGDRARASYRGSAAAMGDLGVSLELGASLFSGGWSVLQWCLQSNTDPNYSRVVSSSFWDV